MMSAKNTGASLKRLGIGDDVYSNVMYKGKLLKDWQKACKNRYSLGELYRMAQDAVDLEKVCHQ